MNKFLLLKKKKDQKKVIIGKVYFPFVWPIRIVLQGNGMIIKIVRKGKKKEIWYFTILQYFYQIHSNYMSNKIENSFFRSFLFAFLSPTTITVFENSNEKLSQIWQLIV